MGSFISKQYSDEISEEEVGDGVDSDEEEAKNASRSKSRSFKRSSRNTHRSFVMALGTRVPSLLE